MIDVTDKMGSTTYPHTRFGWPFPDWTGATFWSYLSRNFENTDSRDGETWHLRVQVADILNPHDGVVRIPDEI